MYSIAEVEEKTGLSSHTLRYYEKEHIIVPSRHDNGRRYYSDDDLKWLNFVVHMRETQMPISEIKQYAILYRMGDITIESRYAIVEKHYQNIKSQLETLKQVEKVLSKKMSVYKKMLKQQKKK